MNPALADLIGRHLAAENAQDLEGTLATLHPDCRFEDLATGQTWRGHDGAAAALPAMVDHLRRRR